MLFWSTIGLGLFYLAYRYNILFVTDSTIDTAGLIYPRALKQLLTGVYLAEICMVGMFAISKAVGPAVLMAIFLIFTILFHISFQKALDPLLYGLPRTLGVEEELLQERVLSSEVEDGAATKEASNGHNGAVNGTARGAGGKKKGNFLTRFLRPWVHADYETLRKLVPVDASAGNHYEYPGEIESNAYWPPSATSAAPILWIPADPAGVSKQEIGLTSKVIPISDDAATLDEKNKVQWDEEGARPPIWSEKIYY